MQPQRPWHAETESPAPVPTAPSSAHDVLDTLQQLVTHLGTLCSEFEHLLSHSRALRLE